MRLGRRQGGDQGNGRPHDDVLQHVGKTAMGKIFVLAHYHLRVLSATAPFGVEWVHSFFEPVYVRSPACVMTEIVLFHTAPMFRDGHNGIVVDTVARTVRTVLINRRAVWAPSGQVAMSNGFMYRLW